MDVRRLLVALLLAVSACGDDDGASADAAPPGPMDWPSGQVPASTVPETGIRREAFFVDGVMPPANPVTGEATPAALNRTRVVRYRQDVDPPAPAKAILIGMPGFLGGAGNWDPLARNLVRQSVLLGEPVEVWAIDRRSNQLENTLGMNTAEAAQNGEIAAGYYFGLDTIDGEPFEGFLPQTQLSYMSEWGLATHVEDLRRVIALVPAGERRNRVFLMGHSLGGSFTEIYAGWRFDDGLQGVDELAGLVMIDGSGADVQISEDDYHGGVSSGLFSLTGLDDIRAVTRYFELPLLGQTVMPLAEIMSLRMLYTPDAIVSDEARDSMLRVVLVLPGDGLPPMTNEAVLGFAFDHESLPLTFAACSCGKGTGGALESYDNPFGDGTMVHPTDVSATYTWIDAREVQPIEVTPLANLAHAFVDGQINLAEWYFPARLPLDLQACGGGAIADTSYAAVEGMRCYDAALVDAPVLGISAELHPVENFDQVKARIAPTIGAGRPLAGADRTDPDAFRAFHIDGFTHMDPLLAAAVPENPVPDAILSFVGANTAAGDVTIPVQP